MTAMVLRAIVDYDRVGEPTDLPDGAVVTPIEAVLADLRMSQ